MGIRAICMAADRLELRLSIVQIGHVDSQNELTEQGRRRAVRCSSVTTRRLLLCWLHHSTCSMYLGTISVSIQPFVLQPIRYVKFSDTISIEFRFRFHGTVRFLYFVQVGWFPLRSSLSDLRIKLKQNSYQMSIVRKVGAVY